jgi:hypothetical protein
VWLALQSNLLYHSPGPVAGEWMRHAQASYTSVIAQLIRHVSINCLGPSLEAFISTVLCSIYEMMDATGLDWQGRLDGISQIGKIRGIKRSCGEFEETAFWCFAPTRSGVLFDQQEKAKNGPGGSL